MKPKITLFCPCCQMQIPDGFKQCPNCRTALDAELVHQAGSSSIIGETGYQSGGLNYSAIFTGMFVAVALVIVTRIFLEQIGLPQLLLYSLLGDVYIVAGSAYAARKAYSNEFFHGILTALFCGLLLLLLNIGWAYLQNHYLIYPDTDYLMVLGLGAIISGTIGGWIGVISG